MRSAVRTPVRAPSVEQLRQPPTHPGEVLLEEFLRPQGLDQGNAARRLHISTTRLNDILSGKRGITAETAWRLSDWLGTGPDVWMNLQNKWDLWQARGSRAAVDS